MDLTCKVIFLVALAIPCAFSQICIYTDPIGIVPIPKEIEYPQPKCTIKEGVKINNTDYADGYGPRTANSAKECCSICAGTDGCNYWAFNIDPSIPGINCHWETLTYCCWMHRTSDNAVPDDRWTSGTVEDVETVVSRTGVDPPAFTIPITKLDGTNKTATVASKSTSENGFCPLMSHFEAMPVLRGSHKEMTGTVGGGLELELSSDTLIVSTDEKLNGIAETLSRNIYLKSGVLMEVVAAVPKSYTGPSIYLKLESSNKSTEGMSPWEIEKSIDESYVLSVGQDVIITGKSTLGISWGASSLIQTFCVRGVPHTQIAVRKMRITDTPGVAYRGLMVDTARALVTKFDLEEAVVFCHFYKIRYLHLHLMDDHAWTMPSENFPTLGSDNIGFRGRTPYVYTKKQLRKLVKFAENHGVMIIPELEGPSHTGAMRRSCADPFQGSGNNSPAGGGVTNASSDAVYKGLYHIMKEMVEIFNTTSLFHIGCDELNVGQLKSCPGYDTFIEANNVTDATDLFGFYVKRMADYAQSFGKMPVLWEGAELSRLEPNDAIVMGWQADASIAHTAKKLGLSLINAPNKVVDVPLHYNRTIYDFGDGQQVDDADVIGCQGNFWEQGWQMGLIRWGPAEVARAAGQMWYGDDLTKLPSVTDFQTNYALTELERARLRPDCN